MSRSLYESIGGLTFPVPASVTPTLVSLDPARDILLDLLAAAINFELGARWTQAVTGTLLKDSTTPVADKLPTGPSAEIVKQRKEAWPLLCVYRTEDPATVEQFTLHEDRLTQRWGVDYILCPLDAGDDRRLRDILTAVAKCIVLTIRAGGHAAYQADPDSGLPIAVLGQGGCGFSSIRVVDFRLGRASFAVNAQQNAVGGVVYHAMSMTLETTENTSSVAGGDPALDTLGVTCGTGNQDGIVADLVIAEEEFA